MLISRKFTFIYDHIMIIINYRPNDHAFVQLTEQQVLWDYEHATIVLIVKTVWSLYYLMHVILVQRNIFTYTILNTFPLYILTD